MNTSRIRTCMIEQEESWSKNAEEEESLVEILQGCEFLRPAKFRRLRKCSPTPPIDCFLTRLFVVFYKFALDLILVRLHIFVISLC